MMGSVYLEGGKFGSATAKTETDISSLSKGSFSLRRAHYFNDIWHEKIISHNLRLALVDNIAMLYVNRGVSLQDLIKEGNLGLTHALGNFELEGGSRFSSYASRCIRQNIERAIMNRSGAGQPADVAGTTPLPTISDSHIRRQHILGRGAKTHHQGV